MSEQTIYGVTSYDNGGNAGYVVHALFASREAAAVYAAEDPDEYDIEEFTLYEEAPPPYTYWHRGAHVYPDKTVEEWTQEHTDQPPGTLPPVDGDREAFDGHLQGHCGLHISIFGTDRAALEDAFQKSLADALERSTGTCRCGRTELFRRDWMDDPLKDKQRAECAKTHLDGTYCTFCHVYTMTVSVTTA